jgi:hypothetical protein
MDIGEVEIIDLIGKGFLDGMIKSWMAEGKIYQSRPGFVRLL